MWNITKSFIEGKPYEDRNNGTALWNIDTPSIDNNAHIRLHAKEKRFVD